MSMLRVACEVALLEADEVTNKTKSEAEREKGKTEQEKILGDKSKVENVT